MSEPPESEGPPNWGPTKPWLAEPKTSSSRRWVVVAVAVAAVVAVVIGATIYLTRDNSGGEAQTPVVDPLRSSTTSPTVNPNLASATDTGPVGLITNDPTCPTWTTIGGALTAAAQQTGWAGRDPSVPAAAWTPYRRTTYEAAATAMRSAADQTAPLVAQTPHRVMRELYEQTIAYLRAYTDSLATYEPVDDHLATVATSTSSALTSICEAITNGAATARSGLIPAAANPTASTPAAVTPVTFFVAPPDPACEQWHPLVAKYTGEFAAWRAIDPNIPAAQWNPAQRTINDAVAPMMVAFADEVGGLASATSNGVFQDFATVAAEYRRAFAAALPSYTPADAALTQSASATTGAIDEACLAIGG